MADKGRVLNKAHALAVVVDDGHLAAFFENFFALYQIDLVCIHHDAQRPLGDDGQCTFGVDEIVLLPGGNESIDQAGRQRGIPADRDDGRHITNFADAEHTLGRTDGVQVTHPVAHDDHMVSLLDELDQLVGHNAAAHLAALFHAMADAAVERKAVRRHLGGLVAAAAPGGSALYLKTAFLLILCGYSCKAELFPLYTVGVDANFAAPAPASALISTGLVNAGFLALLRVYKLLAATEVFPWVKSVLLLVGVLSLVVGALFLRRTNNYKRFLSYSTVENMGIAAIGLGIGGIGVWAAVFHVVCHTLIKSSLFLQIAVVRQVYGNYRINRIGDYIHINRVGAVGLLTGMVVLVAFPPSPLFLSELMILKQTIADGRWWLVTGIMLLLCLVIYFFCSRLLRLCYQPRQDELHPSATDRALSWSALSLLAAAIGLGLWQPAFFRELIDRIASL